MRSLWLPAPYPDHIDGSSNAEDENACCVDPAWACTRWGLPCPGCHQPGGALLPHLFTLTCDGRSEDQPSIGGSFSVALSLAPSCTHEGSLERVGVTHHRILSCSDFPLAGEQARRRAAALLHQTTIRTPNTQRSPEISVDFQSILYEESENLGTFIHKSSSCSSGNLHRGPRPQIAG